MNWIKAKGIVVVEPQHKRIAVSLGFDIVSYYAWLLENHYKVSFSYPRHGGHVSIALPLHKNVNFDLAKKFHKQKVNLEYNVDIIVGGQKKGIRNFWMKVKSPEIEAIKKELKIIDGPGYLGLHLTIASGKGGERKFQKKMIEILSQK